MAINRRQILKYAAGISTLSVLRPGWAGASQIAFPNEEPEALFVGATLTNGEARWSAVTTNGKLYRSGSLPYRGHGIIPWTEKQGFVLLGRSPSTFGLAVTHLQDAPEEIFFEAAPGRHFHGHACFSQDGRLLYTTENDSRSGAGKLGVRRVDANFEQIDELDLNGIGPHDLLLLPDGRSLAIAIGGILTLPDQPEEKLNLDTMESGLFYVDTERLRVTSRYRSPYPQLSVRHLTLDHQGRVWFGCQYEGLPTDDVPLAGFHHPSRPELTFLSIESTDWTSFKQYVGSVAFQMDDRVIAMSSPKGNGIGFWSADEGIYLGFQSGTDVCALAPVQASPNGHWLVGSGKGKLMALSRKPGDLIETFDTLPTQWDNHAILL